MKKCMWLTVTVFCVLLFGCAQAPAGTESLEDALEGTMDSLAEEKSGELTPRPGGQEAANEAYGQILDAFGGLLPYEPGYPGYPEEYGGAYYEEGYLWICLTENSLEQREYYRSLVDNPEILQFKEAAHSFHDLYALAMAIEPSQELVLTSWGVNERENRVDVGIPDISGQEEALSLISDSLPQDVKERFAELPICFQEEDFAQTA